MHAQEGALQGTTVLDLSQDIAGSLCARLLGDYGAEVIKIEPPEGAALRRAGPFFGNTPHIEKGLTFFTLNLNKTGITLNLETEEGRQIFKSLAASADVVVESSKPGYLTSLGLDYEALQGLNPSLVVTSITPFGQTGPYSGYEGEEIVNYAMGAIMSISGTSDREPLKHGGFQAQYAGGLNGAAATSIAIFSQSLSGKGQHIDISITECVASTMIGVQAQYAFTGTIQTRRNPKGTSWGNPMPCNDGWVIGQSGGRTSWQEIADFYGKPGLLNPKLMDAALQGEADIERDSLILDSLKDRNKWELFHDASRRRMLFGVVQTADDLANCPHLETRGFFRNVEHPVIGTVKVPAVLFDMTYTPYQLKHATPTLGQHNQKIYGRRLGYSKQHLVNLRQMGVI
jgi:crotonobetainyl-CoA:carnitine CoA-transferase CaiB-like acyl-CoA transferase